MSHVIWSKNENGELFGYTSENVHEFRIHKTPGRRYELHSTNERRVCGQTMLCGPTSLTKCQAAAENIMTTEGVPTTDLPDVPEHIETAQIEAAATPTVPHIPTTPPVITNTHELKQAATGSIALLGEVIAWCPGSGVVGHASVVNALNETGLDAKYARELLPRYAFTRACKELETGRVIDFVKTEGEELHYQFTSKFLAADEWKYVTETRVTVNKITGRVNAATPGLTTAIQKLLDACLTARTANDITRIVQRLFNHHADLFPIRNQGGAYFVPHIHQGFTDRVETFLNKIGGSINRFPIADAGLGKAPSVTDAVATGLEVLINEHNEAVDSFGLTTHQGTLEDTVERINATRVKIEAYANYLADRKDDLLKSVDDAKEKLVKRLGELTTERAALPPKASNRPLVARDVFGCVADGTNATAMAWLSKSTGQHTIREIVEGSGLREGLMGAVYNCMVEMIDKGVVNKLNNRYSLTTFGKELAAKTEAAPAQENDNAA